ncbi:MAG: DNA-formamidopyrimidine glycosylase family protein [Labilithrix sp.]
MPELPEVETVCRVMRRTLEGKRIASVEVVRDPIVFSGHAPAAVEKALKGRVVESVGRRGKFFWLTLSGDGPTVFGHLGMTGWIREVGKEGTRLMGHGAAPFDDEDGRPRFLRLLVRTAGGRGIAFTDARRFGRIWISPSPATDRRVKRLGPDALDELPDIEALLEKLARRKVAVKAVLLDQGVISGIGNWIADEVLYQAKISPKRRASSLKKAEVVTLRRVILRVLTLAVKVGSDHRRFPKSWLFEHRWGGTRGAARIGGRAIVREIVGGRTTAWVPSVQR